MNKRISIACVLLALSLAVPTSRGRAQGRAEEVIAQTVQAYGAAWNARDATALTNLYTQDADYTGFGSVMARGRDEIQARYLALFGSPNDPGQMALEVSSLRFLKPDVALVDGTMVLTPTSSTGSEPTRALFVAVMTSNHEGWLITALWSKPTEVAR